MMVGFQGGIIIRIRNEVNMLFLLCHCIAHRTNFVALDVAKILACKAISNEADLLLNLIVYFFKKSSKRKYVLTTL